MIVLGLAIMGAVYLGKAFWRGFTSLQSDVAKAVVAGAATVLIAVATQLVSKWLERKYVIDRELRDKRIPIYTELMSFLFEIFLAEKMGRTQPSDSQTVKFLAEFTPKVIIWGSDEVLAEYQGFRRVLLGQSTVRQQALAMERLFFSIRADIGYRNRGLSEGSLLTLFVNDIDILLKKQV